MRGQRCLGQRHRSASGRHQLIRRIRAPARPDQRYMGGPAARTLSCKRRLRLLDVLLQPLELQHVVAPLRHASIDRTSQQLAEFHRAWLSGWSAAALTAVPRSGSRPPGPGARSGALYHSAPPGMPTGPPVLRRCRGRPEHLGWKSFAWLGLRALSGYSTEAFHQVRALQMHESRASSATKLEMRISLFELWRGPAPGASTVSEKAVS